MAIRLGEDVLGLLVSLTVGVYRLNPFTGDMKGPYISNDDFNAAVRNMVSFSPNGEVSFDGSKYIVSTRSKNDSLRLLMSMLKERIIQFDQNHKAKIIVKNVGQVWNVDFQVINAEDKETFYQKCLLVRLDERQDVRVEYHVTLTQSNVPDEILQLEQNIPRLVRFFQDHQLEGNLRDFIKKVFKEIRSTSIRQGVIVTTPQREQLFIDINENIISKISDPEGLVLSLYYIANNPQSQESLRADLTRAVNDQARRLYERTVERAETQAQLEAVQDNQEEEARLSRELQAIDRQRLAVAEEAVRAAAEIGGSWSHLFAPGESPLELIDRNLQQYGITVDDSLYSM